VNADVPVGTLRRVADETAAFDLARTDHFTHLATSVAVRNTHVVNHELCAHLRRLSAGEFSMILINHVSVDRNFVSVRAAFRLGHCDAIAVLLTREKFGSG
jgi:hypothetical protein